MTIVPAICRRIWLDEGAIVLRPIHRTARMKIMRDNAAGTPRLSDSDTSP